MPGVGRRRYGHSHGDVERNNCASSIFYAKAVLYGRSLLSPRQSPAGPIAANLFRGQIRSLLSPRQSPAGLLAANLFCGQGRSLLSPRQSPAGHLAANSFCGPPADKNRRRQPHPLPLGQQAPRLQQYISINCPGAAPPFSRNSRSIRSVETARDGGAAHLFTGHNRTFAH